jgi:hypothetical protein
LTLSELLADLYRRNGYATSPASEITTRYTALLNETQAEILSRPGLASLLHGSLTFASVADVPTYGLPQAVARVKAIYETTNDQRLTPISLDTYRSALPDAAAVTGTPYNFVDLGFLGVAKQPSDASSIFVDSTSASDTNTAYLEGYRTGGYFVSKSVSMTGTTAVNISSAITDWLFLTKFYISAAAVGEVTLHEDASGGTELARIPLGQTHARYRRIALAPTPSAAVTYTVDFEFDPQNLVNAMDEPILPPRFHRLLGLGARMKEYEKKDDDRFRGAKALFDEGLSDLIYFVASQAVGMPVMGSGGTSRPSQLGPWYPSGS